MSLRAPDPAILELRMSEMTPEQQKDAHELWLRNNIGWMPGYHGERVQLLLDRLDAARAEATVLLRQAQAALESCTSGDTSTGFVIHPSFDEALVSAAEIALAEALRPAVAPGAELEAAP